MERNAPCPCGSGRKYKKCHGAAVSPEAATLPTAVRTSVVRAESVLARQRRITQEILDWADRKHTAEWMNAAYDRWGVPAEQELPEDEIDLFTTWAVHHDVPATHDAPVAQQWLAAQRARFGTRLDGDVVALLDAHTASALRVWKVDEAEPGVGMQLREIGGERAPFVYEPEFSHLVEAGEYLLAFVLDVHDLALFGGVHGTPLGDTEGTAIREALPLEPLALAKRWGEAADRELASLDEELAAEDGMVAPDEPR